MYNFVATLDEMQHLEIQINQAIDNFYGCLISRKPLCDFLKAQCDVIKLQLQLSQKIYECVLEHEMMQNQGCITLDAHHAYQWARTKQVIV